VKIFIIKHKTWIVCCKIIFFYIHLWRKRNNITFALSFMSNLSNKSEINIDAAKLLNDKNLYSAVAHCAYYACYQKIKHIWLHKQGKTEQELKNLGSTKPRMGSHEVLINEIGSFIKNSRSKNFIEDSRIYNNNILQLKRLRTKADYEDTVFDFTNSSKSLSLSNEIIPVLNKYL